MEPQRSAPAHILVGVFPGQSPAVVSEAATLAAALAGELVCAYVNPGRYVIKESADGTVTSASVDSDFDDDCESSFPERLLATLQKQIAPGTIRWRTLLLAGEVADALAHCANTVDAALIVVGTHGNSHTTVHEIFNHSVATRLARQQKRPVVVVPTHHDALPADRP